MIHYRWDPYLHVFIKLGMKIDNLPKESEISMIYDTSVFFRNGSILQYVFAKDARNYQNCSEIYKIDSFIGSSLMKSGVPKSYQGF